MRRLCRRLPRRRSSSVNQGLNLNALTGLCERIIVLVALLSVEKLVFDGFRHYFIVNISVGDKVLQIFER